MSDAKLKTFVLLSVWSMLSALLGAVVFYAVEQYVDKLPFLFTYWYLTVPAIIFVAYYFLKLPKWVIA